MMQAELALSTSHMSRLEQWHVARDLHQVLHRSSVHVIATVLAAVVLELLARRR